VAASRQALSRATQAALLNRQALEQATAAAHASKQEAAAAFARLADVERRLVESDTQLRTAVQHAGSLERRLADTEAHLREATEVAPPPIPSGRSVARLEELRATLRAQAAAEAAGQAAANTVLGRQGGSETAQGTSDQPGAGGAEGQS
jgi:chromosome segregation ATPase